MEHTALSLLLRNPRYRGWFVGQAAYQLGHKAQGVVLAWLAYTLSDALFVLGMVAALTTLPQLLLGPLGGWLADRFDERRLVLLAQGAFCTVSTVLALLQASGLLELGALLGLSLAVGVVSGLDAGPRQALVQRIVADRADMPKAVALNALAMHVSRIAGPALAGIALAATDAAWCFLGSALACLPLLATLTRMHPPREVREWHAPGLLRGLAYAAGHTETRTLLVAMFCASLLTLPYIQLLPWFAKHVFAGGSAHYGALFASAGTGSLIATAFIIWHGPAADLTRTALTAYIASALLIAAFTAVDALPVAAALLMTAGGCFTLGAVSLNTRIHLTVPLEVRGRVLALISMAGVGTLPLGTLLMAAAAEVLGTRMALAAGALCTALIALLLRQGHRPEPTNTALKGATP